MTDWSPSTSNDAWLRALLTAHQEPPPEATDAADLPEHRNRHSSTAAGGWSSGMPR